MSQADTRIDVKQAAQIAKSFVADAFAGDGIERVALEEIAFADEHDEGRITVGFSRPWDRDSVDPAAFGQGGWQMRYQELLNLLKRTYKIVAVSAADGRVARVENRPI